MTKSAPRTATSLLSSLTLIAAAALLPSCGQPPSEAAPATPTPTAAAAPIVTDGCLSEDCRIATPDEIAAARTKMMNEGPRCGGAPDDGSDDGDGCSACSLPMNVPAALAVPAGNALLTAAFGQGVQIYECQAVVTAGVTSYSWVFQAPQANLVDIRGILRALHYLGPTWESARDHSTVVGTTLQKVASPDPSAIPWLLLQAVSHTGDGLFSKVSYVQRLTTSFGAAPATGCDAASVGTMANVPYSALYYFYVPGCEAACGR